jgi:hypothetical protein
VFMGPVNLVVGCQQKLNFTHCFIDFCGRETRYGPTNRSVSILLIVSGALLLGAVDLFESVDDSAKGCYALTTGDTYGLGPYTG